MGWFDGWFGSTSSSDGGPNSDPLGKLDPELRKFLQNESPIKYNNAPAQQPPKQPWKVEHTTTPTAAALDSRPGDKATDQQPPKSCAESYPNGVPPESQFRDGRYAHLWQTYTPLAQIEAATKTDHDKLMDVLEGYKMRRAQIGQAALENCSFEQAEYRDCLMDGSWADRITLCRAHIQKFEKCYNTQSRLLKAFGYLSTYDRPPAVEEDIQMRADALYRRMVAQDEAIEAAKAEGKPPPQFPSLKIPTGYVDAEGHPLATPLPEGGAPAAVDLTGEEKKRIQERLDEVPEADRPAEEEALKADLRAKREIAAQVQGLWQEEKRERTARKEEGRETLMDMLKGILGR